MKEGVDLTVTHRHYQGLIKAGKHRDAGALMITCTGVCWSPARLSEQGIVEQSEARCPLCGAEDADEGHLCWECPKVMEAPRPAIQNSNRFSAEHSRIKRDERCRTLYWRGLVSAIDTQVQGHVFDTVDFLGPISECSAHSVNIFTNWSGGTRTNDRRLRRCGWAWVILAKGSGKNSYIWSHRLARWGKNSAQGRAESNPPLPSKPQGPCLYKKR